MPCFTDEPTRTPGGELIGGALHTVEQGSPGKHGPRPEQSPKPVLVGEEPETHRQLARPYRPDVRVLSEGFACLFQGLVSVRRLQGPIQENQLITGIPLVTEGDLVRSCVL